MKTFRSVIRVVSQFRSFNRYYHHRFSSTSCTVTDSKPFNTIPGPFRIPLLGNLYLYKLGFYDVTKYHQVLKKLFEEYGPIVRQDIGLRTIIHLFDPESVKIVYEAEGKFPHVEPLQETVQLYRKHRNLSLGLGNLNGEEWYRLRSAVQQMMLRPAEVQYYLPLISSVADDFIKRLNEKKDNKGEVPNLRSEIAKWSLESSGMVCFETRLGSFNGGTSENEAEKMITANKYIFHLSALLKFSLPLYKYFPSSKWNKLVQEEDYFYGIGGGYVDKTILKINQLEDQGKMDGSNYRFISYLLSKSELSLQDVKIIVLSLFGDGLSTTTPTLLFNLYCLAANPDVQKRAYEEVSSLIKGGPITIELLNQMSYLKAVIKETFRVLPNGTEISRILSKDLVLSGYLVPAGTHVNMNQSVLYHSEKYFVDPDKFLPERWLRGKHSSNIHPYLLIPFGVKARTCAGRRFAEQDLMVLLALILYNFKLECSLGHPLKQYYHTLLFPEEPLGILFKSHRNG